MNPQSNVAEAHSLLKNVGIHACSSSGADALLSGDHGDTPKAQNLHSNTISQPSENALLAAASIPQADLARDTSEVSSEVVIEPPARDDVLEHYVFKCHGA